MPQLAEVALAMSAGSVCGAADMISITLLRFCYVTASDFSVGRCFVRGGNLGFGVTHFKPWPPFPVKTIKKLPHVQIQRTTQGFPPTVG